MREKLIKARGERSQKQLGERYGVTQQSYCSWESGRTSPPHWVIEDMEYYFGVPKKELFPDLFNSKMLLKYPRKRAKGDIA
jgi:DNA-binding XRE family transcriptional regulator